MVLVNPPQRPMRWFLGGGGQEAGWLGFGSAAGGGRVGGGLESGRWGAGGLGGESDLSSSPAGGVVVHIIIF